MHLPALWMHEPQVDSTKKGVRDSLMVQPWKTKPQLVKDLAFSEPKAFTPFNALRIMVLMCVCIDTF